MLQRPAIATNASKTTFVRGRGLSGVEVWIVGEGGEQPIANAIIDAGESALGIAWYTETSFAIFTKSGRVSLWNLNDGSPECDESRTLELKTSLTAFAHFEGMAALGDEEGRVWIVRDDSKHWTIGRVAGHSDTVDALAISTDGSRLASAGRDRSIAVWDTYLPKAEELGPSHSEVLEFFSVAFEAVQHAPTLKAAPRKPVSPYPEAEPDEYDDPGEDPTKDFALEGVSRQDVLDFFSIAQDGPGLEEATPAVDEPLSADDAFEEEEEELKVDSVASDIADSEAELDDGPISQESEFEPKRIALEPEMIAFQNVERFTGSEGWAIALAFSPDGKFLASGGMDNGVYLWDLDPQKEDLIAVQFAHSGWVCAIAWSPDQTYIASGSWDNTVGIFDGVSLDPLFAFDFHRDYVVDLRFTSEKRLFTASYDGSVGEWDVEDQSLVRLLEGHTDWVQALESLNDGRVLSLSSDGTALLWDTESEEPVWKAGKSTGAQIRLGENVNLYDYVEERSRPELREESSFANADSTARFRDFRSSGFGQTSSGKAALSLLDEALDSEALPLSEPQTVDMSLSSVAAALSAESEPSSSFDEESETKLAKDLDAKSSFATTDETKLAKDLDAKSSFASADETKLAKDLDAKSSFAELSPSGPGDDFEEPETKLSKDVERLAMSEDFKHEESEGEQAPTKKVTDLRSLKELVKHKQEDVPDELEKTDLPATAKIPSLQSLAPEHSEFQSQRVNLQPFNLNSDSEAEFAPQSLSAFDSEIATGVQRDLMTRGVNIDTSKVPVIPSEDEPPVVDADENTRETTEGPAAERVPSLEPEEDLRVTAEVSLEDLRSSIPDSAPEKSSVATMDVASEARAIAEEIRADIETISDAFDKSESQVSEADQIPEGSMSTGAGYTEMYANDDGGPREIRPDDVPSEVLDALIDQAAGIDDSVHDAWASLAEPSESKTPKKLAEASEKETAEIARSESGVDPNSSESDSDRPSSGGRFAAPMLSDASVVDNAIPDDIAANPGLRTSGMFDRVVNPDSETDQSPFSRSSTEKSVPQVDGRPPTDESQPIDPESELFEPSQVSTDPSRPTIDGESTSSQDDRNFPFASLEDEARESEASFVEDASPKRTPHVLPAVEHTRPVDDLVDLLTQSANLGDDGTAVRHGTSPRINEPQIPDQISSGMSEVSETSPAEIWSAREASSSPKMGIVRKLKPIETEFEPYFTIRTPHQWVYGVALSHDGKYIASCGGDSTVCIWETSGALKHKLHAPQAGLNSVVFSFDDRMVCSAGDDGHIHVWLLPDDGDAKRIKHTQLAGHDVWVTDLQISADTKYLVSAGYDGSARVWELRTGECLRVLKGHTGPVTSIALGTKMYTAGADGTIRVWNESWTLVDQYPGFDKLTGVCAHGTQISFTSANGDAYSQRGSQLVPLQRHRGEARSCAVRGDGVVATIGEDGLVMFYAPDGEAPFTIIQVGVPLWSIAFDRTLLGCGADDGRIHIFRKK